LQSHKKIFYLVGICGFYFGNGKNLLFEFFLFFF